MTAETSTSLRSAVRRLRPWAAEAGVEVRGVEERGTVCTSDGMVAFSIVLDTTLVHLCTLIGI